MPSLRDAIKKRSIQALKERDSVTRTTLSAVLSAFDEAEKAPGFGGWSEAAEQEVVNRYVKQLKGSLEQMKGSERAAEYEREIELLRPYLPQVLDEAATRELVAPLLANARNMGQFMGMVMKQHKGEVDPALVRKIAAEAGL